MRVVADVDERTLFDRAAEEIRRAIEERCAAGGVCFLGVVGGRSLTEVFLRLARDLRPFGGRVEIFWLDERVPAGQKNADEILPMLGTMGESGVDLRWHPFDGGDRATIRRQADAAITLLKDRGGEVRFDVVVCSAGEDGHVASLFPRHDALAMTALDYVFELDSPKPPPERITVTPALLTSAPRAFLFFTGAKEAAWRAFSAPGVAVRDCPAKILLEADDLTVFTSIV